MIDFWTDWRWIAYMHCSIWILLISAGASPSSHLIKLWQKANESYTSISFNIRVCIPTAMKDKQKVAQNCYEHVESNGHQYGNIYVNTL